MLNDKKPDDWEIITRIIEKYKKEKQNKQHYQLCREFLVTAEDHRFWNHSGVDFISIIRAIWKTQIHKKREGASTIAMQLVRTITGNYRPDLRRKIKEIYYALKIYFLIEKSELLNIYLSIAYFGWNMHGIEQACNRLGYNVQNLTKYQAASLIARLKYPEPKNYIKSKNKQIDNRTQYIIKRHKKLRSNILYGKIFSANRVKKDYLHLS